MDTPPATAALIVSTLARAGAAPLPTPQPIADPAAPSPVWHVANHGLLPCWWLEGPPDAARRYGQALTRRGVIVLLVTGHDLTRALHLMVTLAPLHRAVVSEPFPASLVLARLARRNPTGSRLGDGLTAAYAIDIDAAGRRAFRDIRATIARADATLIGPADPDPRAAWLLLQVTRLLFLRFVEAEGWLNGCSSFLTTQLHRTLAARRDPGRYFLAPLFFGTLNRPHHQRHRVARQFGEVPFLNGGLFEPHPLERTHHWRLPAAGWCALCEPLFTRIDVALEPDAHQDSVTPEMLGRILEGLMDADERRDGGVFYTPPSLVASLLRDTITCHLAPRLERGAAALQRQLDDPDPALRHALSSLRVLDPAVGSGAFLIETLRLLRGPAVDDGRRTRRLLRHALHGIDRNPGAVRITELRLWLELLRTMRGAPPDRVPPLPNLDTTIRGGDALLDPLAGTRIPPSLHRDLSHARRAVEHQHGAAHHAAIRHLRRLEVAAIDAVLASREARLEHTIREQRSLADAPRLFGDDTGRTPIPVALPAITALERLRAQRARLRDQGHAAAFAIESAWPRVLARGGFDLVIGNPPWVRGERLPNATRADLAMRYHWWRGARGRWRHPPDLAVAFVERAHELLRPSGTLGLLLPSKLMTTTYAATARAALVRGATLHVVADLQSDPRAAFDATTYPMALIATRATPPPRHRVRLELGTSLHTVQQRLWRDAPVWTHTDDATTGLLARLAAAHPTLSDHCSPSIGIKTGANHVFLDPPEALRPWTRAAIRGRDLSATPPTIRHRLLWTMAPNGRPMPALPPPVAAYLQPHQALLQHRADQRRGAWWQLFRVGTACGRWRVVWSDLAAALRAHALLDPDPVPLNSCYLVTLPSDDAALRLAAWLSTRWIGALARLRAEPAAGGHFRFGARVVAALPCPTALWNDAVFDPRQGEDPAARDDRAGSLLQLTTRDRARLAPFVPTGR